MALSTAFLVYDAQAFRVSAGANLGDALTGPSLIEVAHAYSLDTGVKQLRIALFRDESGQLRLGENSEIGCAGATVELVGSVSFMSPEDLSTFDVGLLQLSDGDTARLVFVSQAPLRAYQDYIAVSCTQDDRAARKVLQQILSASFVAGTRLLMGDRTLRVVDDLSVGDQLQTRDHGVQPIRWIGRQTVRAVGQYAPIRIKKGALQNIETLFVSPAHRLFVFQRRDVMGAGRAEVMLSAENLVNGVTITTSDGGHVEYFQILFDNHEILYAEGVAIESTAAGQLFGLDEDLTQSGTSQSYEALKQTFIRSEYERFALQQPVPGSVDVEDLVASSRGQ